MKLMDIYRRRGDAADYERTRERLDHHLEVQDRVPEIGDDLFGAPPAR